MKTLMLSIALAAAAAVSGPAWADAECQAGSAWGTKAGCGGPEDLPPITNNSGGPAVYVNPNSAVYGSGYGYGWGNVVPGVLGSIAVPQSSRRIFVDPSTGRAYSRPYATSRDDRDGDGVANWRDRYPDDPRYR